MNLFQQLNLNRVLNGVGVRLRVPRGSQVLLSVPSILFCITVVIALVASQANAQSGSLSQQQQQGNLNNNNNNKNNGEKKGIQCYMCNSVHDPHCGDPFDPSTIEKVDCEQFKPNATVCRKNVQKASLGARTDYRVIRACGYLEESSRSGVESDDEDYEREDRCYNKAGTFEVAVTYCACYADGCNPAPRQATTSFTAVSQTVLQLAAMFTGSFLMLKDQTAGFN